MKKDVIYQYINYIIGVLSIIAFFYYFFSDSINYLEWWQMVLLYFIAFFVNIIKAIRLSFLLIGETSIQWKEQISLYCRTVPVCVLIPYKLGEFYRLYCYSYVTNSCKRGITLIMIERFFDAIALSTILFSLRFFLSIDIPYIIYILMGFVICVLIIYLNLPNICVYWKKCLLCIKASRKNCILLELISRIENYYIKLSKVLKGKGLILFILSFVAWAIELLCMSELSNVFLKYNDQFSVGNYVMSALGVGRSQAMYLYIWSTVGILVTANIVLSILGRRNRN